MNKGVKQGYICVFLSAILWGMLPVFTRLLYAAGSTPLEVSSVRAYLGAGMALLAMLFSGDIRKCRLKDVPFYMLYGTFAIAGAFLFYALSMRLLSTAMAAVLLYTGPAFVNIFNRILYKIPITPVKWTALVLTVAGCALVVRIYDLASLKVNAVGILIGLLSGICYSITTVMSRKAKEKYCGRMNGWLILILGTLPFWVISPPWRIPAPTPQQWVLFVGIAGCCSMIPYTVYLTALDGELDGGVASIVATAEPIAATLFGTIFFGDQLEKLQIAGIVVVIIGVIIPILSELSEQGGIGGSFAEKNSGGSTQKRRKSRYERENKEICGRTKLKNF